jgi:hypothetical protein
MDRPDRIQLVRTVELLRSHDETPLFKAAMVRAADC